MFSKVRQRDVGVRLLAKKSVDKRIAINENAVDTSVLGEMAVDVKSLPENFPKDFPLYYQAELADVWTQKGEELDAILAVWETNDSPKKVFDFYLGQLKLFGWESEIILESDGSYTFSFHKGDVEGFVDITFSDLSETIISATFGVGR